MTTRQLDYLDKVSRHGCLACRQKGIHSPAEIHHVRRLDTSKRRSKAPVIGLCPPHHRTGGRGVAIHAGRQSWEAVFGSEVEMARRIIEIFGEIP